MLVYMLTFASGLKYIGQTKRAMSTRMAAHKTRLKAGSKFPLYEEWRLCGEPAISVLVKCNTGAELDQAEEKWIASENTIRPNGLNVAAGGKKPASLNAEAAKKIAASATGRKATPETKEKVSIASKSHWQDPQYQKRVSDGIKASITPERRLQQSLLAKRTFTGRKKPESMVQKLRERVVSEETRAKMSASAKNRIRAPRSQETKDKIAAKTKAFWQSATKEEVKLRSEQIKSGFKKPKS